MAPRLAISRTLSAFAHTHTFHIAFGGILECHRRKCGLCWPTRPLEANSRLTQARACRSAVGSNLRIHEAPPHAVALHRKAEGASQFFARVVRAEGKLVPRYVRGNELGLEHIAVRPIPD